MKHFSLQLFSLCLFLISALSSRANEQGPGVSSGGQTSPESVYVRSIDVRNLLAKAPRILEAIFSAIEFEIRGGDILNRTPLRRSYSKALYENQNLNIYFLLHLPAASYVVQTPSCKDHQGHGHGGTAVINAGKKGRICLSLNKINADAKKYGNLWQESVLSLIAHEMAHLLGLGEAEAQSVQRSVYSQLMAIPMHRWIIDRAATFVRFQAMQSQVADAIRLFSTDQSERGRIALCLRISDLRRQEVLQYEENQNQRIVSGVLRPEMFSRFEFVLTKIQQLYGVCHRFILLQPEQNQSKSVFDWWAKQIWTIATETKLSHQDFRKRQIDEAFAWLPLSGLEIRKVHDVTDTQLLEELTDIHLFFKRVTETQDKKSGL